MPSLLLISFVEWSGAFQRPQHLAVGFARAGWDVAHASPDYVHRRAHQVASGVELPTGLRLLRPRALPGSSRCRAVARINRALMAAAIRRARRDRWDAVIFNDPHAAGLAAAVPARVRIWDCMDDLTAHHSARVAERLQAEALGAADRIWTGTASLADRLDGAAPHIRFIPCGVEGERFAHPDPPAVASARAEIDRVFSAAPSAPPGAPLALYFGAINERFDMDLTAALAAEGWRVLLIGPGGSRMAPIPPRLPLVWIGPRPYAALPAYLACADLALIPYDTSGPHRFLYPVKALEYLAGAKPVLSSPLPDIERFLGDYVLIEATPEGWARVARSWDDRRADAAARAARGQAYALGRSWEHMIEAMTEDLRRAGVEA